MSSTYFYILLPAISLLLALFITPFLRNTAIKRDLLDRPNERKIHETAIPRIGGMAIVIAFYLTILLGYFPFKPYNSAILGICLGAIIVVFIGFIDDLKNLRASVKFLGQIVAVLVIVPFGFSITDLNMPFIGKIHINFIFGTIFTIFWVIGIMNAINFVDGMDGLAGGVALIISCALIAISVMTKQVDMIIVSTVIAGATLGFLRYNFHPASIFMGDCGAMFLGFMLSIVSIKVLFQNQAISGSSLIPVLIFGLPILDGVRVILRRLLSGTSPFCADKGHCHHRLLAIGLSQRKSAILLYLSSLISVMAGTLAVVYNSDKFVVVMCIIMFTIGIGMILTLNYISHSGKLKP